MSELQSVLMRRDGLTAQEAQELIRDARLDLNQRLNRREFVDDAEFMSEWFSLEPDYIFDVM